MGTIMLGESSRGEVSADLRMAPVVEPDEVGMELELVGEFAAAPAPAEVGAALVGVVEADEEEASEQPEVEMGEPAEVVAGEVEEEEVEADESADEREELLSERVEEPSVREAVSRATAWICCEVVFVGELLVVVAVVGAEFCTCCCCCCCCCWLAPETGTCCWLTMFAWSPCSCICCCCCWPLITCWLAPVATRLPLPAELVEEAEEAVEEVEEEEEARVCWFCFLCFLYFTLYML